MSEVHFGPYRIDSEIAAGSLSTIHKAIQEPLGRVVALKTLKAQIAPTSSFGEQLDRESAILRDLAHPNVVLLLDAGRTPAGRPFIVLEHVEGPSLETLLAKKRTLSIEAALAIGCGIGAALQHVHERGIVHRDVKPSNVLLSSAGVVKVIDFGIAQRSRSAGTSDALRAEGITPSGRIAPEAVKDAFGTPAYMSPEQILGDFVDGRSDLFSLGVVLYQMLSGVRPFEASASQRLRRDAPVPLRERAPRTPRAVERIVMRLLEKSPNERFAAAGDVLERLTRELRARTRDDPAFVVHGALAQAGFATVARAPLDAPAASTSSRRGIGIGRALGGQAVVLGLFAAGIFAIEGGPLARESRGAIGPSLELLPERAGGLRVLASPWAYVRVDGQQVETTPFARPIPLPAGRHWISLSHPDAPSVEREVLVAENETVTLDVTMMVAGVAGAAGAEDAGATKDGSP